MLSISELAYTRSPQRHDTEEEKILTRHTAGSNLSVTLLKDRTTTADLSHCVFTSAYEFYWTSVKEGRLLPYDFDRADNAVTAENELCPDIERLGHLGGCMIQARPQMSDSDREILNGLVARRRDQLSEAFERLGKPALNIYIIHYLVFRNTEHMNEDMKKRIFDELPFMLRKHDHIMPEMIAFSYDDAMLRSKADLLDRLGFMLMNGVYVRPLFKKKEGEVESD